MEQTTENDLGTGRHPAGDLAALLLTGKDARTFLQGQLTNDLDLLTAERPLLAGWNTPKGRLLCISWLLELGDGIAMVLPEELAAGVRQRLMRFILRADVRIRAETLPVAPVPAAQLDIPPVASIFSEEKSISYCLKSVLNHYVLLAAAPEMALRVGPGEPAAPRANQAWRRLMIRCGMPSIWKATADSFVPQMVNLDLCGGISFTKGCYVGQEIVARTQNLGRIKRRMFGYEAAGEPGCAPGDPVVSSGETVGQVVDAVTGEGRTEILAVIRLDARDEPLALGSGQAPLLPRPLPYAID